ncbi:MAG TPA: hypothetical protein VMD31_10715 [Opitutaceae bacterium]|nr:hypothetical protein [Opitutaceae bacterium]
MPADPISVLAPVDLALERTKVILFRPFDAAKWFTIAFGAWLAGLGRGGFNFNFNFGQQRRQVNSEQFRQALGHVHDYVLDHLYWIVPAAIVLALLVLTAAIVFTWLRSRGAFMFLHCVARNRAEIAEPWKKFRAEANSLFVFRLVVALVSLAVFLPLLAAAGYRLYVMFRRDAWDSAATWNLVGLGLGFLGAALLFGLVHKLTNDFVVPVMALRRTTCLAGWAEFGGLLAAHPLQFFVYLLFQIVIGLAIVLLVVLGVLLTCCLAGCILMLPYLGTVLLLPVLVFCRAYSLHYLAQYGRPYDAFAPDGPPAPPAPPAPEVVVPPVL